MKPWEFEVDMLPSEQYLLYIEKAEYIHQMGLHLDKTVLQLSNMIYQKEKYIEDQKR